MYQKMHTSRTVYPPPNIGTIKISNKKTILSLQKICVAYKKSQMKYNLKEKNVFHLGIKCCAPIVNQCFKMLPLGPVTPGGP